MELWNPNEFPQSCLFYIVSCWNLSLCHNLSTSFFHSRAEIFIGIAECRYCYTVGDRSRWCQPGPVRVAEEMKILEEILIPWIHNYYHTTTSISHGDIRRQGQYSLQLAYYLLWYNVSNSPPETRLAEDIITLIKVWGLSRARQLHRQIFSTWENISFLKYIF